jgi:hypothetical protein
MSLDVRSSFPLLEQAVRNFQASDLGKRIGASDAAITHILRNGAFLWSIVDLITSGAPRPHVRLINLPIGHIGDEGFWLDPKCAGLPPYASFEFINVDTKWAATSSSKTPYSPWIANYPRPRSRTVNRSQAVEQIRRSTISIAFDHDFFKVESGIDWLPSLPPRQIVLAVADSPSSLCVVTDLINAGAQLDEHFVLGLTSETTLAAPCYTLRGFADPPSQPLPAPSINPELSQRPSLELVAKDYSGSSPLAFYLDADHQVAEDGTVTSRDNASTRINFSLGPQHDLLPRVARFTSAVAHGVFEKQIEIQGVHLRVPHLATSWSHSKVGDLLAQWRVQRRVKPKGVEPPRDNYGRNLLFSAVIIGSSPELVGKFLNAGLDPDEPDALGWTPLCYAAALQRDDLVLELIESGYADLEQVVSGTIKVADLLDHYGILGYDNETFELSYRSRPSSSASESPLEASIDDAPLPRDARPTSSTPSIPEPGAAPVPGALPACPDNQLSLPLTPLADCLSSVIRRRPVAPSPQIESRPQPSSSALNPLRDDEFAALLPSFNQSKPALSLDAVFPEPSRPKRSLSEVEPVFANVVNIPPRVDPLDVRAAIHSWIAEASPDLSHIDPVLPRFDSERFSVLSDEDPGTGLFALRFDNHVPNGLTFRTEFVVFPTEWATIVSTRLQAVRPPGNEDDIEPSVPRIVASFADLGARHVNIPMGRALPVTSETDAELLAGIIFDPHRVVPLLAVYGPTGHILEALPPAIRSALLIVHVAPGAIPAVQRLIGREFIGFKGAWRIYPPGLKRDSSRYDAPLILDPASIPPSRLANQFRHTIWRLSRSLTEDDCPTYLAARQLILQRQKDTQSRLDAIQPNLAVPADPSPSSALEVLSESIEGSQFGEPSVAEPRRETPSLPEDTAELSQLQDQVKGLLASVADLHARIDQSTRQHRAELQSAMEEVRLWKDLAEDADAKVTALMEERDRAKREAFDLRAQIAFITGGGLSPADSPSTSREYPTSYDALSSWVETHYEGRIVLTKKAAKAAMSVRSEPHIVAKVYEALDLLANEYIESKQGDPEARSRYLDRLANTQLQISHVGEAVNNHRYASEYSATVGNRRYLCDMHVREFGGTDFHPERQLRVYFAWDESNGRVVIGHLPSHLTSTHS